MDKITVFIDDKPRQLFFGLKVRHAIGRRNAETVRAHRAIVVDADGNIIDLDGALADQERLYIRSIDSKGYADIVTRRT